MAQLVRFNKRAIDALSPAAAGKREYYEDPRAPTSLRIAVTDHGAKSWVVQRRVQGRVKRITLGRYPDLTPENALRKAEQIAGQIADGRDPQTEKREARAKRLNLQEAFDELLKVRPLKPKTRDVYRQVLTAALGDWLPLPLTSITKDRVAERHAKLSRDSGGAYADSAMRTLRSVWNFAAGQYDDANGDSLLPPNPVDRLSKTKAWHRVKRRETYIREHELTAWFAAVNNLRAEPFGTMAQTVGDYLAFLLLTGLRRSEGAGLTWDQIDLKARTLTVWDTKNRDDHTLPLSDFLHELLRVRAQHKQSSRFVFPGEEPGHSIKEPRYQIARVVEESGVAFTPHDLRRTFCTVAESLDLSHYALKRLLNHRMAGDVTAGYIGKNIERLRDPMQRITNYVLSVAGVRPSAQVITLTTQRSESLGR